MKLTQITYHLFIVVVLVSGCTSYESASDTHLAREYLTEDLEQQIMFNLIHAKNGLPFAHYDISNVQSAVTAGLTPQVGGGRTVTNNTYPGRSTSTVQSAASSMVTTTLGAVSDLTQAVAKPFSYNVSGSRNNAVTITISPVFDEPGIYAAYRNFIDLDGPEDFTPSNNGPGGSTSSVTTITISGTQSRIEAKPSSTPAGTMVPAGNTKVTETVTTINSAASKGINHFDFGTTLENPTSLMRWPTKPDKRYYVDRTLTYWNHYWYYIPTEFKQQFSELCFAVVARNANGTGNSTAAGKKASAPTKLLQRQLLQQTNATEGIN